MRGTFTYVTMEVTPRAYAEIAGKLKVAGYDHAFDRQHGALVMQGIGLVQVDGHGVEWVSEPNLPPYQCHKHVRAARIAAIKPNPDAEGHVLELHDAPDVTVPVGWVTRAQAKVGGYYVVYEEGYTSYSPAAAFERGYTRL